MVLLRIYSNCTQFVFHASSVSFCTGIFCIGSDFFSCQHVISEPFEPSPFMPGGGRVLEDDFNAVNSRQERGETDLDASFAIPMNEKDNNTRENNVAKIKVVVCCLWMPSSIIYVH